ncbi:MAG: LysE family transporter [Anaerovorax sp.]
MRYFIQGLMVGLAYVASIGVQNLFVINTGLTQEKNRAYKTALIVIFFDVTLALACFFGIGLLMDQFHIVKKAVLLIGGLVVMIMGIMLMKPDKKTKDCDEDDPRITKEDVKKPYLKVVGTSCVVTWFNPQAWIEGSLLLGAFRVSLPTEASGIFILGVSASSCIWFLGVTTLTSLFKNLFTPKIFRGINILCGAAIFVYGCKLIWAFVEMYL